MDGLPSADQLQASVVSYLLEGNERREAELFITCSLRVWTSGDTWGFGDETAEAVHVDVTGPRVVVDILQQERHRNTKAIKKAIQDVLPIGFYLKHFTVHAAIVQIDPTWRNDLINLLAGNMVTNQGQNIRAPYTWRSLRFASVTEMKIAQAFEDADVLFLTNCMARLGKNGSRVNRAADFLVCHNGKWGILEVDGEPFHPATRAAEDHSRDRLFREHGIGYIDHFDATRCYNDAKGVVREFLGLLEKNVR
jgi:hypothetical protein